MSFPGSVEGASLGSLEIAELQQSEDMLRASKPQHHSGEVPAHLFRRFAPG
jgi:hypothetical protein